MVSLRPAINSIIEETVHGLVDAECTLRENTYCHIGGPITIDITLSGVCEEGILFSSTDELVNNKITIKGIGIDMLVEQARRINGGNGVDGINGIN